MSRKVYVEAKVKLILEMDDGVDLNEVMDEMHYDFQTAYDTSEILDATIDGYEIKDSK
jgi:hypothetical protein